MGDWVRSKGTNRLPKVKRGVITGLANKGAGKTATSSLKPDGWVGFVFKALSKKKKTRKVYEVVGNCGKTVHTKSNKKLMSWAKGKKKSHASAVVTNRPPPGCRGNVQPRRREMMKNRRVAAK